MKHRYTYHYVFVGVVVLCTTLLHRSAEAGLAEELTDAARRSLVQGRINMAAGLLRGAWELTGDVKVLRQLGRTLSMSGQFEEAIEVYEDALQRDPKGPGASEVKQEIKRLKSAPTPFRDQLPTKFRATPQARRAFKDGMALSRRKKYKEALPYLRAALVLDPELPGTYRVLGGIYGKLGDPKKEREFLRDYLRIRPDGRLADMVRKRLKGSGLLTALTLTSSFPCEIWVNGRPMGRTTPVKDLLLPKGNYTISFINGEYHVIRNKRVAVGAGGTKSAVSFAFGVLKVDLKPWARVRADGRDLGLWNTLGLPVGEYKLSLVAHDGSKRKDLSVFVEAGKTTTGSSW